MSVGLAIFFACAFYFNYWRWRECIEQALSSCVTPEGNFTTGGMFWGYPCLPLLALSYGLWMRAQDLRREREAEPSPSALEERT